VNDDTVRELLDQIQRGIVSVDAAAEQIAAIGQAKTAQTVDASVDVDRQTRCGFPEVVFAQGKSVESVVEIFAALAARGQDCLATRVSPEQAAALLARFPHAIHNSVARTVRMTMPPESTQAGMVAVITAGTSDRPVAEEVIETLHWMGCLVELIVDVGVAGPHRLLEHKDQFAQADAIVVVAGMEGALPSVVGGHVSCPVIAVPTSVGYGASFGGVAALLGMLNSCAANVTVVNIDGGFKGGYVAGLIARRCARRNSDE
jgi:NCAIR mutase (PurE)-related protein